MGMIGIFVYVGAEVAIGTFLVNYAMENMNLSEAQAANLVAFYWGGAMVGRFIGIFSLKIWRPGIVLSLHAVLAAILLLISISTIGPVSVYSLILIGVCNSVMFPTIFTLALKDLKSVEKASGLLATAIIGGAIIPYFTGILADSSGLKTAFILPGVCYIFIVVYGWSYWETKTSSTFAENV